jgi:DNA-binding response OmpR family regulator
MSNDLSRDDTARLRGKRVLLIEDEYLIADDLNRALSHSGVVVIGPIGTLEAGLRAASSELIDIAILDINLRGEWSYPIVDELLARNIPVVLATGYDEEAVQPGFSQLPRVQKPYKPNEVLALLHRLSAASQPRSSAQ